jgi:hypothetical protein
MRPDGPDEVRASLARIDAALLSVTDGALFEQGIKAKLGRTIRPTDSNIVHTERDRLATRELLGLAGLRCGSINLLHGAVHKSEIRPLRGRRD